MTELTWMPAKAYGGRLTPSVVVVHCTESDNGAGTAESLAGPNWFGGSKAGTSAHKMFDRDSGVEMVKRTLVAFHAGPRGNTVGVSYEFCGRVSWSAAKWREPEQLNMLRLAAPHIADDLRAMGAPARWLSLAQLAAGARGMCTHNDVRLALGGTTHSDPGPNFPYAELLSYVLAALAGAPIAPPEDDVSYSQWPVEDRNKLLNEIREQVKLAGPTSRYTQWPLEDRNRLLNDVAEQLDIATPDIAAAARQDPAAVAAALLPGLVAALPAHGAVTQVDVEAALRNVLRAGVDG